MFHRDSLVRKKHIICCFMWFSGVQLSCRSSCGGFEGEKRFGMRRGRRRKHAEKACGESMPHSAPVFIAGCPSGICAKWHFTPSDLLLFSMPSGRLDQPGGCGVHAGCVCLPGAFMPVCAPSALAGGWPAPAPAAGRAARARFAPAAGAAGASRWRREPDAGPGARQARWH